MLGAGGTGDVGDVVERDEIDGNGGAGVVGEVGTGESVTALPTAGFCNEFDERSPLLGIICGTTGTEPICG